MQPYSINMKKLLKLTFILTLLSFSTSSHAQDIHFSNYQLAPLSLNPALAGAFKGTVRLSGIFRGQWWAVAGGTPLKGAGYHTMGASVDSPIIRGLRKQDWIGVGISYVQDIAGSNNFKTVGQTMNLAYHLSLDKKQTRVLTFGLQWGSNNYSIDMFGNPIIRTTNGLAYDMASSAELTALFSNVMGDETAVTKGVSTLAVGTVLTTQMNKKSDLRMGVSMTHLLAPDRSLTTDPIINDRDNIARKFQAFATIYQSIGKRSMFTPSLLVQRQDMSTEIQLQGIASYLFSPEKDLWLNYGLGLRPMSAADLILFLGADIKDIRVGMSYDINFSGLSPASRGNGAMELGVSYIWKLYKKPNPDPIMICPRR